MNYGMSLQNETDADALPSSEFYKTTYKCKGFSYVVFASQNIVDSIAELSVEKRKFLMDATFKVCPYGIHNQLLVVHVEHLNEVSNLIFGQFPWLSHNTFSWHFIGSVCHKIPLALLFHSLGIPLASP